MYDLIRLKGRIGKDRSRNVPASVSLVAATGIGRAAISAIYSGAASTPSHAAAPIHRLVWLGNLKGGCFSLKRNTIRGIYKTVKQGLIWAACLKQKQTCWLYRIFPPIRPMNRRLPPQHTLFRSSHSRVLAAILFRQWASNSYHRWGFCVFRNVKRCKFYFLH